MIFFPHFQTNLEELDPTSVCITRFGDERSRVYVQGLLAKNGIDVVLCTAQTSIVGTFVRGRDKARAFRVLKCSKPRGIWYVRTNELPVPDYHSLSKRRKR